MNIERIEINPGDIVVLEYSGNLSQQCLHSIMERWRKVLRNFFDGKGSLMVLPDNISIKILSAGSIVESKGHKRSGIRMLRIEKVA